MIPGSRQRLFASPLATAVAMLASAVVGGVANNGEWPSDRATEVAGPGRPNIVVVMTDDQRTQDVRFMKHVGRDLKAKGVTFKRFYATFPLCCPSRATYFTGQYAHNHGVFTNALTGGFKHFDASATTPLAMKRAGYRTALVGKYLNGYAKFAADHPSAMPPGYSQWFVSADKVMYDWQADVNGELRTFKGRKRYQTNFYGRVARRFIRNSVDQDKPFFLTLATHAPHREHIDTWPNPRPAPGDYGSFSGAKLPKPPSFNEKDVSDKPKFLREPPLSAHKRKVLRRRYRSRLETLLSVDRLVHELVRQVRRSGELGDTWFFFTSDNGYFLGEHRLTKKDRVYEEAIHQPLIVRGPKGKLPRGVVRRQITGNIDLSPTILDLAGVDPMLRMDGISLLPLARDPRRASHRSIMLENRQSQGVRARGWIYVEDDPDRDGSVDAHELYNMRRDPHQLRNRYKASLDASAHPALAAARERLARRLDELRDCAGAACR